MEKNVLTRRQFVRTISAGAGGVLVAGSALASSGVSAGPGALDMVNLGNSGLKTTFLGMGTGYSGYNRSSNITRAGIAESLIREAYDRGVRFFDCADSYGTHPFAAAALKGIPRDKYILSTKMWVDQGGIPEPARPGADIVIDRFRKELKTDYLDLVQIHCMTDPGWSDNHKRYMDTLETLKAKNIIRAHGVSVHSIEAMKSCIDNPWVDVVHVRVNPYGESMDRKDPGEVIPVIERLHKNGKGVIGMKLIGNGRFRDDPGKIDATIKYVMGLGIIDMVIIGFELPDQIDDYIARIEKAGKS